MPGGIGAHHHVLGPYGQDEGWGTGTEFGQPGYSNIGGHRCHIDDHLFGEGHGV